MQNNSAGPVTDKRRLILDAAQHVFAENGFHTSTMDAVAEAAGVAKGTIYLYFKGKNELLIDLVDDRTGQLTDMILQGIATARDVRRVWNKLRLRGRGVIVPYSDIGVDIDKPSDVELALRMLA
jgi:AcrR family transcriptional regulator